MPWTCKKQNSNGLSTTEAEYISARLKLCPGTLDATLREFGLEMKGSPLYCDNTSPISITKNSLFHFITKHIEVKYHFIIEDVQEEDIDIQYVTRKHLRDIFTKPLGKERFLKLR